MSRLFTHNIRYNVFRLISTDIMLRDLRLCSRISFVNLPFRANPMLWQAGYNDIMSAIRKLRSVDYLDSKLNQNTPRLTNLSFSEFVIANIKTLKIGKLFYDVSPL